MSLSLLILLDEEVIRDDSELAELCCDEALVPELLFFFIVRFAFNPPFDSDEAADFMGSPSSKEMQSVCYCIYYVYYIQTFIRQVIF